MIPKFSEGPASFVLFIQHNRDIFDNLLLSGKHNYTRNFNKNYIIEAYNFFVDFNLRDDPSYYCLCQELESFNDDEHETDINDIINEFNKWIESEKVQNYYDEYVKAKKRTIIRTLFIKNELSLIDYIPEDKEKSVNGKIYRILKNEFNNRKS